jgi:hypothetical protein
MNNEKEETIPNSYSPPKRNLFIILPKMISLIPEETEYNFKDELEKQLENAAFTAPENIYNIWVNVQSIITRRFKKYEDKSKLQEWSIQLLDIWTNKQGQQNNSDIS